MLRCAWPCRFVDVRRLADGPDSFFPYPGSATFNRRDTILLHLTLMPDTGTGKL
ncbi:hypothetical protein ASZ90_011396 [hydrocarbon metagenome]|uniref:Uncharacterized protein n=1 Tax=hydrocarbon metagenome TaxID=938273 RepID=A0A0W8FDD7_9ZZZZ